MILEKINSFVSSRKKVVLQVMVALLFLFPILFLCFNFSLRSEFDFAEFIWAAKNTFIQALLSSGLTVVLGLVGAYGLIWLDFKKYVRLSRFVQLLCLFPNFIPVLFLVIAAMGVLDPFPLGISGIVLIHVLMNQGLASLMLRLSVLRQIGGYLDYSYTLGVSRFLFFRKIVFPLIRIEVFFQFLFFFIVFFGSFSVPLLLGAGRGTTLEVLIYEKIRMSSDWGGAVYIAVLQSIFIFALSLLSFVFNRSNRKISTETDVEKPSTFLVSQPLGLVFVLAIPFIILFGYLSSIFRSLSIPNVFNFIGSDIGWALLGSWGVSISMALIIYFFFLLLAYILPAKWLETFLNGYVNPGSALVGFTVLIFLPNTLNFNWIKLFLILLILYFPGLFRTGWNSQFANLSHQLDVAKVLGAREGLIFNRIIWPQIHKTTSDLSILAAVWAAGDFAMSRMIMSRDMTLAMQVESLMSGYRLPQATVLSLCLLFNMVLIVLFLKGVSRVTDKKLIS